MKALALDNCCGMFMLIIDAAGFGKIESIDASGSVTPTLKAYFAKRISRCVFAFQVLPAATSSLFAK